MSFTSSHSLTHSLTHSYPFTHPPAYPPYVPTHSTPVAQPSHLGLRLRQLLLCLAARTFQLLLLLGLRGDTSVSNTQGVSGS